jgi:hypothetical protein
VAASAHPNGGRVDPIARFGELKSVWKQSSRRSRKLIRWCAVEIDELSHLPALRLLLLPLLRGVELRLHLLSQ